MRWLLVLVSSSWYLSHDVSIGHVEIILIQFTATGNRHIKRLFIATLTQTTLLSYVRGPTGTVDLTEKLTAGHNFYPL